MIYLYEHPITKEVKEIFQGINDTHIYVDESGTQWNRVFTVPCANVDTEIDAFSQQQFVEKTGKKKGTVGDLMDKSRELSEKRRKSRGEDPVAKKFFENYAKERNGKKHKNDPTNPANKTIIV